MKEVDTVNVYLVGSKCIGQYGGFETFVKKLLEYHRDNANIKYHVACKFNGEGHMDITRLEGASEVNNNRFTYCNADCFMIKVPLWLKSAQAIYYDIASLKECCRHIKENGIQDPIVYVMACRIGPFFRRYVEKIHKLGGKIYLNPDGHEWKRTKWTTPVRKYWKGSERLMVKHSDLIICDSINIQKYINEIYKQYQPQTVFIAYGAELKPSKLKDNDEKYVEWLTKHDINKEFFTLVGRCIPENNYETIIREFMKSKSKKDLVIISTDNSKMLQGLEDKLHYKGDSRIKFVGTIYDQELLKKIREECYGYFHGHSVGGTNPSLLEALGSTKLNLIYDVGFNREVAEDAAVYWNLEDGNLAKLIDRMERLTAEELELYSSRAKRRIQDSYSWTHICGKYEEIFEGK